jgi:hypothetical protein
MTRNLAAPIAIHLDDDDLAEATRQLFLSEPGFAERVFQFLGNHGTAQLSRLLDRIIAVDLAPAARAGEYVVRFRVCWPDERGLAAPAFDGD